MRQILPVGPVLPLRNQKIPKKGFQHDVIGVMFCNDQEQSSMGESHPAG